jgi:uncharacterized protein YbjT (DUF2867 family)
MYVVFGANGRAGGEVARSLIDRGEAVRVVLRRPEQGEPWKARGAEVAIADISVTDAAAAALAGASGAFLLNPPPVAGDPHAQAEELGVGLAEAIRKARLHKAVILSSIGAQHASGTGVIATLNRIERLLDGASPATAFLRSGYFVETWSEVASAAMSDGVLPTFLEPARKVPMVSTMDVGRAAARLMTEVWTGKRIVELSGPQDWSAADVAIAFAEMAGRPVEAAFVAPDQRAAIMADMGVPAEVAAALLEMYEAIAAGRFAHEPGAEECRGTVSLTAAVERIVKDVSVPAAAVDRAGECTEKLSNQG